MFVDPGKGESSWRQRLRDRGVHGIAPAKRPNQCRFFLYIGRQITELGIRLLADGADELCDRHPRDIEFVHPAVALCSSKRGKRQQQMESISAAMTRVGRCTVRTSPFR